MVGRIAFPQINAQRLQLQTHRGIDLLVTATDSELQFRGQSRQAAHEGAADAQYVDGGRAHELPCATGMPNSQWPTDN